MKKFQEVWQNRHFNRHCHVFGDQLASHYCPEVVRDASKHSIFLWSLPANTSHYLQPLDDVVFARLKQSVKTLVSGVRLRGSNAGSDVIDRLHSIAYEAETTTFTKRAIQRAFQNTGLCPFDVKKIVSLTRENLGLTDIGDKLKHVKAMTKAVQHVMIGPEAQSKIERRKSVVTEKELCNPEKLVKYAEIREAEKEKLANDRKRKREKEEEERVAKRLRVTSCVEGCTKWSRSGRGKEWKICESCKALHCKNYRNLFPAHVEECSRLHKEPSLGAGEAAHASQ